MNPLRSLQVALGNLRANKLRAALTMLGVIIGVSAVIIMVSIVEGARATVVQEFERIGSKMIFVFYQPTGDEQKRATRRIDSLTMDDVRAIEAQCPLIQSLSAETGMGGESSIRFRDREVTARARGVQAAYSRLHNVTLAGGRFLTEEDMAGWNKVCVIGAKVRQQLFGSVDPLGKQIEVNGVMMTVVGAQARKGQSMGEDVDKTVLMPITTVHKRLLGYERVGIIYAQPRHAEQVGPAMDQVWECLMRRYNNAPGFQVDSQENILNAVGRVMTIFGLVVGGVAGLSLLVGGIGIMNIMLVSVTERTREIGLRKAVGARRRDILWQFLIEAATVSGTGGLIGIGVGAGVAYAVGAISARVMQGGMGGQPGIAVHLPFWAVGGAFVFSAFVGVFFGIYPAIRAARLDPIEALRHE